MRKLIPTMFLLTFFCLELLAQLSFDQKWKKVAEVNELRGNTIFAENRDSIYYAFIDAIDEMVKHPDYALENFQNKNLDTFSFIKNDEAFSFYFQGVNVKFAPDTSFSIVSWSDMGGGSRHSSSGYFVYTNNNGRHIIEYGGEEYAVAFVYDIHLIKSDDEKYYMVEGWASGGGGHHSMNFEVYHWDNDSLLAVDSSEIYVGCNRSQSFDYEYDKENKQFFINAFEFDYEVGFYNDSFQRACYIWEKNKFILKTED